MSEQIPQKTKQEAKETKPKTTITEKLNSLLPWLRFGFNLLFCLVFMGVLIWGGYCLWENTKPSKEPLAINELIQAIKENTKPTTTQRKLKENTKVEQEFKNQPSSYNRDPFWFSSTDSAKTTIESTKEEDIPECYTIQMDDFENALKAVALVSRQEASDDYHKSLSIIVAMLAIFGIIFPIVIALIQNRFNERDIKKKKKTAIKADNTTNQVKTLQNRANKATEIACIAASNAQKATDGATKAVRDAGEAITNANNAINKAGDATNRANGSLSISEKSLEESKKLKNEIIELAKTLYNDISNLFFVLYKSFSQHKDRYNNLNIILHFNSHLCSLRKMEVETREVQNKNDDLNITQIKQEIDLIKEIMNDIIKEMNEVKSENTELFDINLTKDIINDCLNSYQIVINKLRKNLPGDLHNEIDNLQKVVQDAIKNTNQN